MFGKVIVGVLRVSLNLRHSRSLKDKRQVLRSITERLRREGFSVGECGGEENQKQSVVGLAFVSHHTPHVEKMLDQAERVFVGFEGLEVIGSDRDVFDYSELLESRLTGADEAY